MKMYRILVCILIVLFAFNSSCASLSDVRSLKEVKKFDIQFDDEITQVGVLDNYYERYLWCKTGDSKITVVDYEGIVIEEFTYDSKISNIYSRNKYIVLNFEGTNCVELIFLNHDSNNDNELITDQLYLDFSEEIREFAYSRLEKEYTFFALLNNDDLYSFDLDGNPRFLMSDVLHISGDYALLSDGHILNLLKGESSDTVLDMDNQYFVYGTLSGILLLSDNSVYSYPSFPEEIRVDEFTNISFYESSIYGEVIVCDEGVLYTGSIDAETTDKSAPFVERTALQMLPDDSTYYPLFKGVLCYSDSRLAYYDVVGL